MAEQEPKSTRPKITQHTLIEMAETTVHEFISIKEFVDGARTIDRETFIAGAKDLALADVPAAQQQGEAERLYHELLVIVEDAETMLEEASTKYRVYLEKLHDLAKENPENREVAVDEEFANSFIAETMSLYIPMRKANDSVVMALEHTNEPLPGVPEALDRMERIQDLFKSVSQAGSAISRAPSAALADFPVHTAQEWQAYQHIASDGKCFDAGLFKLNEQGGSMRYKRQSDAFFVELRLTDQERDAGYGVNLLRDATRLLDVDSAVICYYVSELLSPVGVLPANTAAFAWIDLDDVANKTLGGYASNPTEKQERRAQVYHAIRFFARAFAGGCRSIPYFDKQTGQEIPTKVYVTPWQISGKQESETPSLWPELDVPLRVRLVASPEWTALTTSRDTAQWLPLGEKIGAIPGKQPSGAWARALGLSYLTWCRINPHAALRGEAPSRRALLDTNTPKKQPYKELLETNKAYRIREYWATAESHLRDAGIIQPVRHKETVSKSGSDEWRDQWLNVQAPWQPGPTIKEALEAIVSNKYLEKPRQLNPAKRRGRPKKAARNS